jgi:hypothetical protein
MCVSRLDLQPEQLKNAMLDCKQKGPEYWTDHEKQIPQELHHSHLDALDVV